LDLNRSLVGLAVPMVLANLSVALLGMVDTAVVGHLDDAAYLGGVALASIIFDFLFWTFAFLRMSTTGFVAQRFGADRFQEMRDLIVQALALALVLAAVVLVVSGPILAEVLPRLDGSDEVKRQATLYYHTKIWGAPFVFAQYVIVGAFIGAQNTRAPMVIAICLNAVNVSLDFLFVFGFGWGVRGVALASVIAEMTAVLLGTVLLVRTVRGYPGRWQLSAARDLGALSGHLGLNATIMIRTLCLIFTFAFFTNQGARLGDTVLAANAILMNFLILMALGLDGFAQAVEALTGRFYGASDSQRLRRVVALGMRWSLAFAVLFTVTFASAGSSIIDVMTDLPEVDRAARAFLPWMIVAPLVGVWPFLYDGIFIGATRGRDMMWTMMVATFGVFLPAWWMTRGFGNHGLWFSFVTFLAARGGLLGAVWQREMAARRRAESAPGEPAG